MEILFVHPVLGMSFQKTVFSDFFRFLFNLGHFRSFQCGNTPISTTSLFSSKNKIIVVNSDREESECACNSGFEQDKEASSLSDTFICKDVNECLAKDMQVFLLIGF